MAVQTGPCRCRTRSETRAHPVVSLLVVMVGPISFKGTEVENLQPIARSGSMCFDANYPGGGPPWWLQA